MIEVDRARSEAEGLKVQLEQKNEEYMALFGKQQEKDQFGSILKIIEVLSVVSWSAVSIGRT